MYENLRAEMKRHNKTNEEVGRLLGITGNSVSFKLNGKSPFTIHELWKLADEFKCTLDYLAGRNWTPEQRRNEVS